jgi:hypothetical protein
MILAYLTKLLVIPNLLTLVWFVANILAAYMGLVGVSSQILAQILANYWRANSAPKNWLANFGRASMGIIQTGPNIVMPGSIQ